MQLTHDFLSSESMIAGHTTDYVNSVIKNVESGDNSGGLNLKKNHKTWADQPLQNISDPCDCASRWGRPRMC